MHRIPSELRRQVCLGESSTRIGDLLGSPRVALLFVFIFLSSVFHPGLDNQAMSLVSYRDRALWELATRFVTSFRTTFIFYASPSDFPIKSYCRLKFSTKNSHQLKISRCFPTCEDSSAKYTLNRVTRKKFGSKIIFLPNFYDFFHIIAMPKSIKSYDHEFTFFVLFFFCWPSK